MTGPVLCAVDLGSLGDATAGFAACLARVSGVSVTLLHVPERGDSPAEARARLEALARTIAGTDLVVATESAEGDPAEAIARRAAELDASAVVLGTHGGRGLERFMLGSVAETVLHAAACPVATLREAARCEGPIRRIVCGVDLADTAPLRWAAALARRTGADLIAVHAVPALPEGGGHRLLPASFGPGLLEEAREGLAREIRSLGALPRAIRSRIEGGPAPRALIRCAEEESADVLVVGVHPHILGSTTHPVVRGAGCPVVTIPARSRERESE